MAGFAAGGSAGVQDVFAVLWGEQGGGVLRGGVLYADGAVVKAGDVLDVVAVHQGNGLRVQRVGAGVAVRGEPGIAVVCVVEAQGERRLAAVAGGNRRFFGGVLAAQPVGQVGGGGVFECLLPVGALALDAAQDGVDEAFGAGKAVVRREVHGFVDDAVVAEVHL